MDALADQWNRTRQGAFAGRGFHYQDAATTNIALLGWARLLPVEAVIPEGHEDVSIRMTDGWIHAQVKSRTSHRGDFSCSEVADFLVKAWTAHEKRVVSQPGARIALVLERPVQGFEPTGWDRTISTNSALAAALRPRLQVKLGDVERVQRVLSRASLVTIPEPRESSILVLSERLALPNQACTVHYQALKSLIGDLADNNRISSSNTPAQLSTGDTQRILDKSTQLVDIESLEVAIRTGICEIVDFLSPLPEERFFEGVDVKPGHVVAGLPVERPELQEEVLAALQKHQPVLIVGPSGAGKSALAWLSAFASRHLIRWYRVRRLANGDTMPLVRMISAMHPSDESPIGLVVDDLGRSNREGWDELVEAVSELPGTRLLGVVREEDLFQIQSAPVCHQTRPRLDEQLAERIWRELESIGLTDWEDWREPFQQAEGLLLEFGYLLTAGERLRSTILTQVNRRITERRTLELKVLRLISASHVWGASLSLEALRRVATGESDEDLQNALARLVDEHLVRSSVGNSFSGMHQVRSRHIQEAVHQFGVPALPDTISLALSLLDINDIHIFVVGVLTEGLVADQVVINSLANRLTSELSVDLLISTLHALRMASFVRLASGWNEILEEESVPPFKRVLAAELALAGITDFKLLPSLQSAIGRMEVRLLEDLRTELLEIISDKTLLQILNHIVELEGATLLMATLVGIPPRPELVEQLQVLRLPVKGAALEDMAQFLAATRAVDPDLAQMFVQQAGGNDELLKRVEEEQPWVRNVSLEVDKDEQETVRGDFHYVSREQGDAHTHVVDLCRLLLNLTPSSNSVACRALDASGAVAGYGNFRLADKLIPRKNLPSDAEISWNRSRFRIIATLLSAHTQTQQLVAERSLLIEVHRLLGDVADYWCRNQKPPNSMTKSLLTIRAGVNQLRPKFPTSMAKEGPLDQGALSILDPASELISGLIEVAHQLSVPDEPRPALAEYIYDILLPHADKLTDGAHWNLLSDRPTPTVLGIREVLFNLHQVLAEYQHSGMEFRSVLAGVTKRVRAGKRLSRCAVVAQEHGERRLVENIQNLVMSLGREGVPAQVERRLTRVFSGNVWPPDEIAILVEVPSVFAWEQVLPPLVAARQKTLEAVRRVVAAPTRHGRVLMSLGGTVQSQFYPLPDELLQWAPDLTADVLKEETAAPYWDGINALAEVSGICGGSPGRMPHPIELSIAEQLLERLNRSRHSLTVSAASDRTGYVNLPLEVLTSLLEQVLQEKAAFESGLGGSPEIALAFLDIGRYQTSQIVQISVLVRLILLELDADPEGASSTIENHLKNRGIVL